MTWTHDDPAQGSPAAIQGMANLRSARAGKIRDAQRSLQATASGSGAEWKAMSQTAFASKLSKDAADIELLATGLETQAAALQSYAGQLSQLKDRQRVLEQQRSSAEYDLGLARLRLRTADSEIPALLRADRPDPDATAAAQRKATAAHTAVDEAHATIRAIDAQWDQLVADRRSIDATCTAALQADTVLGGLSRFSPISVSAITPDALLDMLVGLSATDREILLRQNPELATKIGQASPDAVAAWWAALSDDESPGELSEAQAWFIQSMPATMGALDGLAPGARVAANRINAERRLEDDEARLAAVNTTLALVNGQANPSSLTREREALEAEIKYLRDATSQPPRVQLYLYQPETSRIIEMIGTLGTGTKNVVTYSPGTFADLNGFYQGQTQSIARALVAGDPTGGTVAFVYKDGLLPGEDVPKSGGNMLRINEANQPDRAAAAGRQLASFEHGLAASSPDVQAARSTAIGHSWGLANVTSSEVAGAQYDTVISLAGAGMPADWTPRVDTKYVHESYPDLLWEAQLTGQVWDGRNPLAEPAFESHFWASPESFIHKHTVLGVEIGTVDQGVLMDNHNLVATASTENRHVLEDIDRAIYGER